MVTIYNSDWIFYNKAGAEVVSKDVITKRLPVEFLKHERAYRRALSYFNDSKDLQIDKQTGFKRFTVIYKQNLGTVNNPEQHLENLH